MFFQMYLKLFSISSTLCDIVTAATVVVAAAAAVVVVTTTVATITVVLPNNFSVFNKLLKCIKNNGL